jgi:hypothetical protein
LDDKTIKTELDMSVKAYRILESNFETENDCYKITKKISKSYSFKLGDVCDALVDYNSLSSNGDGEFTVNVGAILSFIDRNHLQLEQETKAALLEDVQGKSRDDEVRYECM